MGSDDTTLAMRARDASSDAAASSMSHPSRMVPANGTLTRAPGTAASASDSGTS